MTTPYDDDEHVESMEDLLEEESRNFRDLRRGDVVEGTVISIGRDGVIVDVGSKSEGIIPLSEMHSLGADPLSKIQMGDKVIASVMQPETAEGQVLVSLDRARGERGWRTLQTRFEDGESFEGEVTGFNKGGLLVNVEGVNAFVPLSQVVGVRPDQRDGGDSSLGQMVGRNLRLKVIEINRRRNRVILSERAATQEHRARQKEKLLSELAEGEIRRGRITSVRPFGVFVDLGGADGLAHLSELTWERGKSPEEIYKVGDEVDAYVMKVDPETKKIALSLRRAQPERWEEIVDRYRVGQLVPGRITKLVTFGAFARIEGPVEGLIHVSELSERRITHPREVVHEGDVVPLKIVRVERDKHRIGLSLRGARDDAERMGWEFNDQGGVHEVPDYMRSEVEAKLGVTLPEPAPRPEPGPNQVAAIQERPATQQRQPQPPSERGDRGRDRGQGQQQHHIDDDFPQTQIAQALRGLQLEAREMEAREARESREREAEARRAQNGAGVAENAAADAESTAPIEATAGTDEALIEVVEEQAPADLAPETDDEQATARSGPEGAAPAEAGAGG
ncbi:MAG: S1 RNA-binding domain-containing protein [Chloroflexi bacterium]|nr:S1 RNA-binding domain-containing protein [Chloroflexota bacterium]